MKEDQNEPTLIQLYSIFFYLGTISFGGPIVHIEFFRKYFIYKKNWLSEDLFNFYLNLSQSLPGPTSSQLCMCIGHKFKQKKGSFVALLGFMTPSFIVMSLLALRVNYLSHTIQKYHSAILAMASLFILDSSISFFKIDQHPRKWGALLGSLFITSLISLLSNENISTYVTHTLYFIPLIIFFYTLNQGGRNQSINVSRTYLIIYFILIILSFIPFVKNESYMYFNLIIFKICSTVFGGGINSLNLAYQFIEENKLILKDQLNFGLSIAQFLPGPLYSFFSFAGTLVKSQNQVDLVNILKGFFTQMISYLPSFLLIFSLSHQLNNQTIQKHFNKYQQIIQIIIGVFVLQFLQFYFFKTTSLSLLTLIFAIIAITINRLYQFSMLYFAIGIFLFYAYPFNA